VPEEWELEGPAVSISLGDAADLDPALSGADAARADEVLAAAPPGCARTSSPARPPPWR
jgi:hypothetical protein